MSDQDTQTTEMFIEPPAIGDGLLTEQIIVPRAADSGDWTALVEVGLAGSADLTAEEAQETIEWELRRANALSCRVGVMCQAPACPACGAAADEPCAPGCEGSR
jgi:hypothetical protein